MDKAKKEATERNMAVISQCFRDGRYTIICPCGESIGPNQKVCPKCGKIFSLECASCRAKLNPSMKFCPECGAKV